MLVVLRGLVSDSLVFEGRGVTNTNWLKLDVGRRGRLQLLSHGRETVCAPISTSLIDVKDSVLRLR